MNSHRLLSVGYLLLLGFHVYAGQFTDWPQAILMASKPLLMIYLLVWWFALLKYWVGLPFGKWIGVALFFSWLGDVLLMFQKENAVFFSTGLGAFLLAHVAYIVAFTKTYRNDHEVALLRKQGWLLVAVVGYGVYFFGRLSPGLGSMTAPVMLYTVVIMVMLLLALNRWGKVSAQSFWWTSIGAVLFIASDSILAYNKFASPIALAHLLIMGTYGLAQWAIFMGMRTQALEQSKAGQRARSAEIT